MPLHDFYCGVCGQVIVDHYVPVQIGATDGAPEHCGKKTVPIPGAPAVHYGSVKTAGFKAFDTTDGRGLPVHIDSVQKLRQVERESEQAFRNGEGQPMIFRRWAQDKSNADQPTLSRDYNGGEQPSADGKRKFGSTLRKSATEPDATFGPGVSEANASALAMSGKE